MENVNSVSIDAFMEYTGTSSEQAVSYLTVKYN